VIREFIRKMLERKLLS